MSARITHFVGSVAISLTAVVMIGLPHGGVGAAVIDGAVVNIDVSPKNPRPNQAIRTSVFWCVPDGTRQGDTFTITMPEQLGGFPPSFELPDPNGELVATAIVRDATSPVSATITMSEYAENHSGVCGVAFFDSFISDRSLVGTEQELVYVINDDLEFSETVNVIEPGGPVRTQGVKRGEFADNADQCRTRPENCIEWVLTSRVGPLDAVVFDDLASAGLTFSCADLSLVYWSVREDGTRDESFTASDVGATTTSDCGPDSVSLVTGPIPDAMLVRLRIPATPDVAVATGGVMYENIATIRHDSDGETVTDEVDAELLSAAVGGGGIGVGIDIEKLDAAGNDADSAADAVLLPDGSVDLVFVVTNDEVDQLVDVVVADAVTVGGASVNELTCDFSEALAGAPTSGTEWSGPFPSGASFTCTALLVGVEPGALHADTATVTATGELSGESVDDADEYHAVRNATTTTVVDQGAVTTTTDGPASPTTSLSTQLPATGGSVDPGVVIALGAVALGAVLTAAARRRRQT